jgi:GWxTD domain-containing protein
MVRIVSLAAIMTCFAWDGLAQPRFGRAERETGQQPIYYEAVSLPGEGDSLNGRIDVFYRIDREFFIPVRDIESDSLLMFHRRGEILVEALDSSGTVAGRAFNHIRIPEATSERRPSGTAWDEGMLSVMIRPGTYRIHLTVDDLESKREFADKKITIRVPPKQAADSLLTSFLIKPAGSPPLLSLAPMNYGGGILFGRPSELAIAWLGKPLDSVATTDVSVAETPAAPEDAEYLPQKAHGSVTIYHGVELSPVDNACAYTVKTSPSETTSLVIVPIPTERLLLRSYTITVGLTVDGVRREAHQRARAVWPDMPFSLRDIDYALEALKYITSEEELDSLRQGDLATRRMHLETFWRTKDRTPGTAFNEVMTEYYRRVDYAVRTFGTLRQPDGFRSDRGKVYILYGPPTKTDRMLDPEAGFREVWIYDRLNKRFTFVDQNKTGNYILVNTSPL